VVARTESSSPTGEKGWRYRVKRFRKGELGEDNGPWNFILMEQYGLPAAFAEINDLSLQVAKVV
jgi:hypothetical protein